MLRVALKGVLARKGRIVTTGIAVMLGVGFVVGTLVLSDTIRKVFDDLFADVNDGIDVFVRSSETVELDFGPELRGTVTEDVLATVLEVEGVVAAEGQVGPAYAQFVDQDGEPIGSPGQGAPTFGFNWLETDELNPFTLLDGGEAPTGPDEVVMDRGTAEDEGFEVGDTVTVLSKVEPREFTITGIARFGTADSPAGASVALFEEPTAQELLGTPGEYDGVAAVADESVDQPTLAFNIGVGLELREQDAEVEVLTGAELIEEEQNDIAEGLSFFTTALLTFAIVALIVGGFVIYNTFSILVAQRAREMALLRAIGAARKQVIGSVLIESVFVGLIGGAVGVGLGVLLARGLQNLLNAIGLDIPSGVSVVTFWTVFWGMTLGLVTTMVAALIPAWKAARIPPVAAMRDVALDRSGFSRVRTLIGLVITAVGVLLVAVGLFTDMGDGLLIVGIGAGSVFLGMTILGPVLAPPVATFVGAPLPRLKGITGRIARDNALRNPKRTASTAAALMIGVGLVGFITIFADSAKGSIEKIVDEQFVGDIVVDSGSFDFGGVSPDLAEDIRALPETDAVSGLRYTGADVGGFDQLITSVDNDAYEIFDIGIIAGSTDGLEANEIGLFEDKAVDFAVDVGDTLPVTFPGGEALEMTVASVYTENTLAGDYVVNTETYLANVANPLDTSVFVLTADDTDTEDAVTAIEGVAADYPNAEVQNLDEFKSSQSDQINQFLFMIYALLALAVIIALFGIANTLALSIIERRRELGLLRAVGMTRRQVRSAVRWESVIIAVFGTLLGLAIGLFFGWALVRALADEGFDVLRIPVGQLLVVVAVAALAGVGAAIVPARRASRTDILDAVFDE